jgi:hypothetical protein
MNKIRDILQFVQRQCYRKRYRKNYRQSYIETIFIVS